MLKKTLQNSIEQNYLISASTDLQTFCLTCLEAYYAEKVKKGAINLLRNYELKFLISLN